MAGLHQRPTHAGQAGKAGDPGDTAGLPDDLSILIMQAAAIAHQRSIFRGSNNLPQWVHPVAIRPRQISHG